MKLRTKAVLSGAVSVVVSVLVTTLALLALIRAELVRQAHEYQNTKMKIFHELLREKGDPRVVNGKMTFGNYVANGDFEVVDRLVSLAGGTATIFLGDTRISTNVLKDDGSRAVGTPLVGAAKEITIERGQPFRGEADILGIPYFTAYDPILDVDGRTMGVLYVGVKQEEFFSSFRRLGLTAGSIAVLMMALFASAIWYTTGRTLRRLSDLAKTVDAVSMGDGLETPLTSTSQDEVGELTESVDRLRESMREALSRISA